MYLTILTPHKVEVPPDTATRKDNALCASGNITLPNVMGDATLAPLAL